MSPRKIPLVPGEIFDVFNRTVAHEPAFDNKWEIARMLEVIEYYMFDLNPIRYSKFKTLPIEEKKGFLTKMRENNLKHVEIYSFAIMPNHYHILLKQLSENGISKYIGNLQNSFARYHNIKNNRVGATFQSPFKATLIESDEQFTHVARYIHLNPLTSLLIKNRDDIFSYAQNSFMDYSSNKPRHFMTTDKLKTFFRSRKKLVEFTLNQLDYQRKLDR